VRAKETMLRHVLERSGFMPEKMGETISAPNPFGYRNRVQLHGKGNQLGFYKRRSHAIVDIASCPITHEKLNAEFSRVRQEMAGSSEPFKIELALQEDGSVIQQLNQPNAAMGFSQVHGEQNENLKRIVAEQIRSRQARSVLELYAGNGNLTSAYIDSVQEVFAVELSATALSQARQFLGDKPTHTAFLERRIDSRLGRSLPRDFLHRYDTLLLDPPRSGAEAVIEPLIQEAVQSIIYVSCSPVAFTKDVACLKDKFRFEQIQIVDMFPHTRHIEFVASFSRLPS
jgi:23S rRNA (uracil1939-C5)-methyltransferase